MVDQIAPSDGRALPEVSPYLAEILAAEWVWRSMGGEVILVTAHGGARVVIVSRLNRATDAPCIMTPTEQEGGAHILRPITPDHPLALVLAAVPDLVRVVTRAASEGAPDALEALAKTGLA